MGVIAQFLDTEDKAYLVSETTKAGINDADAYSKAQFQTLLPAMIQVIGQCVETGNEPGARQLFDVLETLLILVSFIQDHVVIGCSISIQEVPILSKIIPDLVEFLLRCGGNRTFETELRILALNALNWTVQ
jgi:importin-4